MLARKKWMSTYQSILFTTFFNKLNIRKCWNIKMNVSYVCNLHLFLHKIHIHASCLVLILRKTHWFKIFSHFAMSPKTVINLTCKHQLLNRNGKRRLIMPVIIDDDNELFLWYGTAFSNFQPGPLPEILIISNLWHAASRVWASAESVFRLFWMTFCSSDNHYTTASL